MFAWSTAGESHGRALVALMEGAPAGLRIETADIEGALARRRRGHGRGARQAFERDRLTVLSGIRHGTTIGSPIALEIANSEWPKWQTVMSPDPVDPAALLVDAGTGDEREVARNRPLTKPRPGHADLVGMNKYGFDDARPVLERASARETAARVALGAIAAAIGEQAAGIRVLSRVVSVGVVADGSEPPRPPTAPGAVLVSGDYRGREVAGRAAVLLDSACVGDVADGSEPPGPADADALDESPVRCLDSGVEKAMVAAIDAAKKDGDTLGGVVEVLAYGVPQGLGTYATPLGRLDARIAAAMMSVQAVKGVEIGDGFASAARRGSRAHDEMVRREGRVRRLSNRAGGVEGGMSNGEPIRVRLAFKPISTVPRALRTIDTRTGEEAVALHQRSDTTAVVPGAVIAEAMLSLVIAECLVEKFGGDSMDALRASLRGYLDSIPRARR